MALEPLAWSKANGCGDGNGQQEGWDRKERLIPPGKGDS